LTQTTFVLILRVHRLRAEREAVDVADDLGDRHRADDAERVRLGHATGDDAGHVRALVRARVVRAHVVGLLVAGGVLELDVLQVGGDLEHRLHVAERRAEDQLVALARHVAEDPLGVGGLGHLLDERGLHLAAELLLDFLPRVVVRERSSRRRRPGRRRRTRS
jgi:hypothetical protein